MDKAQVKQEKSKVVKDLLDAFKVRIETTTIPTYILNKRSEVPLDYRDVSSIKRFVTLGTSKSDNAEDWDEYEVSSDIFNSIDIWDTVYVEESEFVFDELKLLSSAFSFIYLHLFEIASWYSPIGIKDPELSVGNFNSLFGTFITSLVDSADYSNVKTLSNYLTILKSETCMENDIERFDNLIISLMGALDIDRLKAGKDYTDFLGGI